MIEHRPFASLGAANHGWLDAHHHFSFADYHHPARTQWGRLRVWNDDVIAPGAGFPLHAHQDMEIVTYVRSGAITHRDSLGNEGRTGAGDVQVMSAGTGIRHSEFNLESEETTLFQIWILPDRRGEQPGWGARPFPRADRGGRLVTLASGMAEDRAGDGDALSINADARVLGATIGAGETVHYAAAPDRHLYLVPAAGQVAVSDADAPGDGEVIAQARDGVAINGVARIAITAIEDAELVLVDVA